MNANIKRRIIDDAGAGLLAGATLVEIVDLPASTDLYRRDFRRGCRYRLDC